MTTNASVTAPKRPTQRAALTHLRDGSPLPLLVGEVMKNKQEIIRGEFCNYNGKLLFQCRIWYRTKEGELRPTRDGWAVQRHAIDNLFALIAKARRIADENGLLQMEPPG